MDLPCRLTGNFAYTLRSCSARFGSNMFTTSKALLGSFLLCLCIGVSAEEWLTDFTSDALAGNLKAAAIQDDWLYVGGSIGSVGPELVPSVVAYDLVTGEREIVDAELEAAINDLVFFDDGTGSHLYAATFSGVWSLRDGRWEEVGSLSTAGPGTVFALEVFDFGNGPQLVAAGDFFLFNFPDPDVPGLAAWDGASWRPIGASITGGQGADFTIWNDNGTERLVVLGAFFLGPDVARLLIWDGSDWQQPIESIEGLTVQVDDVIPFPSAGGEDLVICGNFERINGVDALGIARWDGDSWSAIDGVEIPINLFCNSMAVLPETDPPVLLFSRFQWDGSAVIELTDPTLPGFPWVTTAEGRVLGLGSRQGRSVALWGGEDWLYPETFVRPLAGWRIEQVLATSPGDGVVVMAGRFIRLEDGNTFDLLTWDGAQFSRPLNVEEVSGLPSIDVETFGEDLYIVASDRRNSSVVTVIGSDVSATLVPNEVVQAISVRSSNGQPEVIVGTDEGVRRWNGSALEMIGSNAEEVSTFHVVAIDADQADGGIYAPVRGPDIQRYDGVSWTTTNLGVGAGVRFLERVTIDGVDQVLAQLNPGGLIGSPGENFVYRDGQWVSLGVSRSASSATGVTVGEAVCYFVGSVPRLERNCGSGYTPLPELMVPFGTLGPNSAAVIGFLPRYPVATLSLGEDDQRLIVGNRVIRIGNVASAGAGTFDPKVITVADFE